MSAAQRRWLQMTAWQTGWKLQSLEQAKARGRVLAQVLAPEQGRRRHPDAMQIAQEMRAGWE